MEKPQLNESKANEYIGKTILLCMNYLDHNEKLIERKQWFGVIETFSNKEGIRIRLSNSDYTYCLPPHPGGLQKAEPGIYRLKSTGEEIENPDYIAIWDKIAPKPKGKE